MAAAQDVADNADYKALDEGFGRLIPLIKPTIANVCHVERTRRIRSSLNSTCSQNVADRRRPEVSVLCCNQNLKLLRTAPLPKTADKDQLQFPAAGRNNAKSGTTESGNHGAD
jgi:hypothetical protein